MKAPYGRTYAPTEQRPRQVVAYLSLTFTQPQCKAQKYSGCLLGGFPDVNDPAAMYGTTARTESLDFQSQRVAAEIGDKAKNDYAWLVIASKTSATR